MKHMLRGALLLLLAPIAFAADNGVNVLESARAAIRVKDYRRAVATLQPAVRDNLADAQFLLASLYRTGLGVAPDPTAARQLLTAAANQQHPAAAYSLAAMLAHDEPRDLAQAQDWLRRAAKAGHRLAQSALDRGSLPLQFLPDQDLSEAEARRAAFWLAIQEDEAEMVAALADGKMIDATDEFGRGTLSHAAQRGATHVVALLIEKGAKVDQADSYGTTPLMLAAAQADLATVDLLLKARAAVDSADRAGNTALMQASGRTPPDVAVVARLLQATRRAEAVNVQGWSALDWAIAAEAPPVVTMLRAQGLLAKRNPAPVAEVPQVPLRRASGNVADLYRGLSDAQVAATRPASSLLQAVLQSTPEATVPAGALYSATVAQSVPTLEVLLASTAGKRDAKHLDALNWAVRHADTAVVRTLVSGGIGAGDAAGEDAPLIVAARAHRADNALVLLDAQFPVDGVDANGMSALMIAAATAQADMVGQLLRHLARTDLVDKAGRSALWYAAAAGAEDVVQALLAARTAVDIADKSGQTPLAVAAARGHEQIVAALLKAGGNASAASGDGATPLMLASHAGSTSVMRALLAAGARVDAQNRHGDTALIIAARNGQTEAVRVLVAAGASEKLRNADRATARDVASALGLGEVEKLLSRG